jgi:hypothetical protein
MKRYSDNIGYNIGRWNAYVESGKTREERAARLAEVPESIRQNVMRHVEAYFRIRAAKVARERGQ